MHLGLGNSGQNTDPFYTSNSTIGRRAANGGTGTRVCQDLQGVFDQSFFNPVVMHQENHAFFLVQIPNQ